MGGIHLRCPAVQDHSLMTAIQPIPLNDKKRINTHFYIFLHVVCRSVCLMSSSFAHYQLVQQTACYGYVRRITRSDDPPLLILIWGRIYTWIEKVSDLRDPFFVSFTNMSPPRDGSLPKTHFPELEISLEKSRLLRTKKDPTHSEHTLSFFLLSPPLLFFSLSSAQQNSSSSFREEFTSVVRTYREVSRRRRM